MAAAAEGAGARLIHRHPPSSLGRGSAGRVPRVLGSLGACLGGVSCPVCGGLEGRPGLGLPARRGVLREGQPGQAAALLSVQGSAEAAGVVQYGRRLGWGAAGWPRRAACCFPAAPLGKGHERLQ